MDEVRSLEDVEAERALTFVILALKDQHVLDFCACVLEFLLTQHHIGNTVLMQDGSDALVCVRIAVDAKFSAHSPHHQERLYEFDVADVGARILTLALQEERLFEGVEVKLEEGSEGLLGVPDEDNCGGHGRRARSHCVSDAIDLRLNIGNKLHRCRP